MPETDKALRLETNTNIDIISESFKFVCDPEI